MRSENTRTKIIATIGPASRSEEKITALAAAGMDVARMNFSHSTHTDHETTIGYVRKFNAAHKSNLCLLGDLQGPKIRTGIIEGNGIELITGKSIQLTSEGRPSTAEKLFINYKYLSRDLNAGEFILLDDGKLKLQVLSKSVSGILEAKIIHGGILTSKKGVNFPNSKLSIEAISEKDKEDLELIFKHKVEWIALSFVRNAEDIVQLKQIISKRQSPARVIAKIEKPEAIQNIHGIIQVSDAIMVARGDLGVEMDLEQVPILQKQIVKACIQAAKPVIIATQMMESMISSPTPTRAETNDVTNAVLDGTDAVMLSAETSTGKYPVETVRIMDKIVRYAERQDTIYYKRKEVPKGSPSFLSDEVCHQACTMAAHLNAKAIVSMTHSGYTAFQLASFRPKSPIFIFTDNPALLNTVNLVWGVTAFSYSRFATTDESINDVNSFLKEKGFVSAGDLVINTASMPLHQRSRTNTIKVTVIE